MNRSTVTSRLVKYQPESAQQLLDVCRLPIVLAGSGAFRDVYSVIGTDVVIKIPRKSSLKRITKVNLQHAKDEYSIWKRIKSSKRKYSDLRPYLPEFYHFNERTGVVAVKRYDKVPHSREVDALIRDLEELVTDALGTEEADIQYSNLGLDTDGSVKITDLGLFIKGKV